MLTLKDPKVYAQDFVIPMMVPNQNSVVFYCKTTMWSCLSGIACSHVVAEPAHVLELAIVVHPLRISQVISSVGVANFLSRHDV